MGPQNYGSQKSYQSYLFSCMTEWPSRQWGKKKSDKKSRKIEDRTECRRMNVIRICGGVVHNQQHLSTLIVIDAKYWEHQEIQRM